MNIKQDIEKVLMDEYIKGGQDRLGTLSVTDIPYCPRKAVFKLQGRTPSYIPPSWPSTHEGRLHHQDVQDILKRVYGDKLEKVEAEVSFVVQTKNKKFHVIKGHIDGLLRVKNDPPTYRLLEIKTYNEWAWKSRKPIEYEYQLQSQMYMGALRDEGMEVPEVLFILKRRAHFELDTEVLPFDPVMYDLAKGKAAQILEARSEEDFPRLEPDAKGNLDWRCSYCPYLHCCWKNIEPSRVDQQGLVRSWRKKNEG